MKSPKEVRIKVDLPIPDDVKLISKIFKKNGFDIFLVGGAVRDFLSKKPVKDYDLATNASPDDVIKIGKENNLHIVDTFKQYGRVDVNGYEVVTFRRDIGDKRKLDSVEFSTIEDDVNRRDFTINALFYDLNKNEIVDLVGGFEDLKNNVIRTVGNPNDRFSEDPIRKLRALRFFGSMGGDIDEKTYQALKDNPSLGDISREKIKEEFIKGLEKSKSVKEYLDLVYELGFINQIYPDLNVSDNYPEEKNIYVLIAYLLKDNNPKILEKQLNILKYATDEIRKIKFLVSLYNFDLDNILNLKNDQKIAKISDRDILKFGKHIGKNFNKFIKFEPSVTFKDVPKDLKGKEIGNWILQQEKNKFSLLKEFKNILISKSFGYINEQVNKVSEDFAVKNNFFGPVYHGTTPENFEKIQKDGFTIFIGNAMSGQIRHGYDNVYSSYGFSGAPPPVHHLGYGIYFTTSKENAKKFNLGNTKNLKKFYLDIPNLEIINFGSENTMMKWWVKNGYDPELARKDRVQATINLTDNLKSKHDAVWFKGKSLRTLLDGDQIVVFDVDRIYQIDPKLSTGKDIGAKVIAVNDIYERRYNAEKDDYDLVVNIPKGTKGIVKNKNPKYYTVTFKPGGTTYNIKEEDIEPI